jgi:hypothetical protein
MPDATQKGVAVPRDDTDAFDFTITLAGAGISFNTAEVVAVTQRFDLAQLKTVTDVEIRLTHVSPAASGLSSPLAGEELEMRGKTIAGWPEAEEE